MALNFHLVYQSFLLCRFFSLLENAQNIYYWIAKAGSTSGRQGTGIYQVNNKFIFFNKLPVIY